MAEKEKKTSGGIELRLRQSFQSAATEFTCSATDEGTYFKVTGTISGLKNELGVPNKNLITGKIRSACGREETSNVLVSEENGGYYYSANVAK